MRVSVVQRAASLDPAENLAALEALVPLAADADLIVLPEASARDFGRAGSDLAPYAEPLDGPFVTGLGKVAGDAVVVAGMFEVAPDETRPFNTVVAVHAGGLAARYRKIHLYDSFGHRESTQLTGGEIEPALIEVAGLRVGLMTCYDLRFPELGRALVDAGAEVLVVPSAWVAGERKIDHWRTLLRARAIENTTYVVGAGQAGPKYVGHSMVVAPDGDVLVEAGDGPENISAELTMERLAAVRRVNPSLANRRMNGRLG